MDKEKIKQHYENVIKNSEHFGSQSPVNDMELLYPDFLDALIKCFSEYSEQKPEEEVYIVETYRSNALQEKYYDDGKSRIRRNGMHYFGLAADAAFYINGKFSYNGDYNLLREIFRSNGLTVLNWEKGHVQFIKVSEQNELRRYILG
ncbi:MAG: hypothetical protein L0Y76_10765 [Ignavibacteria bacterium]|nr:hypothetical protein [Ignavibacteria bacterium]